LKNAEWGLGGRPIRGALSLTWTIQEQDNLSVTKKKNQTPASTRRRKRFKEGVSENPCQRRIERKGGKFGGEGCSRLKKIMQVSLTLANEKKPPPKTWVVNLQLSASMKKVRKKEKGGVLQVVRTKKE